jgi:four helix bundle protein
MEYTKRRNVNRGYMKLEVWNEAMALFQWVFKTTESVRGIDFKLRSQIINAAQSISANIAEGYCRRSINEYLQFLNIALGSSGELMTRMIGLLNIGVLQEAAHDKFDSLHFSMENKLIALIRSLQHKRKAGDWIQEF